MAGIGVDITARKQAEEALRTLNAELDQRVQERTADLERTNAALQTEIAERTRTEEVLQESEERLRAALAAGNLGTWRLDLTTGVLDSSPICKTTFGLSPEAELSYQDLIAAIHPRTAPAYRRQSIKRWRTGQTTRRSIASSGLTVVSIGFSCGSGGCMTVAALLSSWSG